MTDFQLGLLVAGALLIAGVVIYNKVQERSAGRRAERSFGSQHGDVLLDAAEARREPTFATSVPEPARGQPAAPAGVAEPLPDPQLDYVIELELPEALPGAELLRAWEPFAHRFAKRALLAADGDDGAWSALPGSAARPHTRFRAGFQLVTRRGAADEAELVEFRSAVETLAAQLGATLSTPEMKAALDAARALDRLCADVDVQAVIHVVAPEGRTFRASKLRATAEASGFALEDDGRFVLRDGESRVLYTLAARDGSRFSAQTIKNAELGAVSLTMDVPRAPDTRRTYEAMVRFARQLAAALGGGLVDDNGRALDERALAAIGEQLDVIPKALEARGFVPGSPAALRLFS